MYKAVNGAAAFFPEVSNAACGGMAGWGGGGGMWGEWEESRTERGR